MNIVLENNSSDDFSSISDEEKEIILFLHSLSIPYIKVNHEAIISMDSYKIIEEKTHSMICKNLFLTNRQQTKFYLLVMKGDKAFKTKELSSQINSARLSFANEEKLKELLHCFKGSTSILGLFFDKKNKVSLLIDEDILMSDYLGFHPCVNTSTLILKREDILNKYLPSVHHSYQTVKLFGK